MEKKQGRDYYCHGFMCTDQARIDGLCIFHYNLVPAPKYQMMECPRCGVQRQAGKSRKYGVCRDCKVVLSSEEKMLWAA